MAAFTWYIDHVQDDWSTSPLVSPAFAPVDVTGVFQGLDAEKTRVGPGADVAVGAGAGADDECAPVVATAFDDVDDEDPVVPATDDMSEVMPPIPPANEGDAAPRT